MVEVERIRREEKGEGKNKSENHEGKKILVMWRAGRDTEGRVRKGE